MNHWKFINEAFEGENCEDYDEQKQKVDDYLSGKSKTLPFVENTDFLDYIDSLVDSGDEKIHYPAILNHKNPIFALERYYDHLFYEQITWGFEKEIKEFKEAMEEKNISGDARNDLTDCLYTYSECLLH